MLSILDKKKLKLAQEIKDNENLPIITIQPSSDVNNLTFEKAKSVIDFLKKECDKVSSCPNLVKSKITLIFNNYYYTLQI